MQSLCAGQSFKAPVTHCLNSLVCTTVNQAIVAEKVVANLLHVLLQTILALSYNPYQTMLCLATTLPCSSINNHTVASVTTAMLIDARDMFDYTSVSLSHCSMFCPA